MKRSPMAAVATMFRSGEKRTVWIGVVWAVIEVMTLPEGFDRRNNVCDEARNKSSFDTARAVNSRPSTSGDIVLQLARIRKRFVL